MLVGGIPPTFFVIMWYNHLKHNFEIDRQGMSIIYIMAFLALCRGISSIWEL